MIDKILFWLYAFGRWFAGCVLLVKVWQMNDIHCKFSEDPMIALVAIYIACLLLVPTKGKI